MGLTESKHLTIYSIYFFIFVSEIENKVVAVIFPSRYFMMEVTRFKKQVSRATIFIDEGSRNFICDSGFLSKWTCHSLPPASNLKLHPKKIIEKKLGITSRP